MAERPTENNTADTAASGSEGGGATGSPGFAGDATATMTPQGPGGEAAGGAYRQPWSQIWQMPVFILGAVLLGAGLAMVLFSPRPKEDINGELQAITKLVDAGKLTEAAGRITKISARIDKMTKDEQAIYYLLRGDLTWSQILAEPYSYDNDENRQKLVKYYAQARQLGAAMDPSHWRRWATAQVSLGHYDEALKTLDQLTNEPAEERYMVIRQLIERRLALHDTDPADMDKLRTRFSEELRKEKDPAKVRVESIWVKTMAVRALLDANDPEDAIKELVENILPKFQEDGNQADLAPLKVLLAKAYQQIGELGNARQWYLSAQKDLKKDAANPLNADVLVGLAQVTLSDTNDVRAAMDLFSQAESASATPAYFDALIGKADCEARLGDDEHALEHFGNAVKLLAAAHLMPASRVNDVTRVIQSHYDDCFDKENYSRGLDYLMLLNPLFPKDLPPWLLASFAITHEKIAQGRLQDAQAIVVRGEDPAELNKTSEAKKLAYQEAAIDFGLAADFYFCHAQAESVTDDAAYGNSLWAAAVDYDRAQLWKKAIDVYAQYVKTRNNDPRQLEATNHLGLAYMADGQYLAAESLFKDLIEHNPNSPETFNSLVPLARCYVATGRVDDGIRVLRGVVTDNQVITRQSQEYRDALIELGKLLYQQGDYVEAIQELAAAVERYGDTPEGAMLRFRLADAYRQSVGQLDKTLKEPLTQSARAAMEAERRNRLEQAKMLFSQVVSALEARDPQSLSPIEKLFHRNAYFYEADCAYDMGQYEHAISLYDRAAKRWDNQPASLVALVQIVNAYCELGRIQEARVTNERARAKLKQLPDKAFDDPSLPMTRKHWEDWLKWTNQLDLYGSQASASDSGK